LPLKKTLPVVLLTAVRGLRLCRMNSYATSNTICTRWHIFCAAKLRALSGSQSFCYSAYVMLNIVFLSKRKQQSQFQGQIQKAKAKTLKSGQTDEPFSLL